MMIEMSALSRLTGGIRDLLPFCHGRENTKESNSPRGTMSCTLCLHQRRLRRQKRLLSEPKKHSLLGSRTAMPFSPTHVIHDNLGAIGDEEYGDGSGFLGWFREFMNICLHECQISQLYRAKEEQRGSVRGENFKVYGKMMLI